MREVLEQGNMEINKSKHKDIKTLGLMGGSFDPIHKGHIALAKAAIEEKNLDLLIFMPVYIQPFKPEQPVTSGKDRFEMVKLASQGLDKAEVWDFELKQQGYSYTINTLRALRENFGPQVKIYFITGTDAFFNVELWRESEEVLKNYSFIVGKRPGEPAGKDINQYIKEISLKYGTDITTVQNKEIEISSTELRAVLQGKKGVLTLKDYLDPDVERYILEHGLYKTD